MYCFMVLGLCDRYGATAIHGINDISILNFQWDGGQGRSSENGEEIG